MNAALSAIGAYLRELRIQQRLSRCALAEILGVAERTVLNWEQGRGDDIKLLQLQRALTALGGTLDDVEALIVAPMPGQGQALARCRLYNAAALHSSHRYIPSGYRQAIAINDIALQRKSD